jgi:pimeloyl-ACP methyl ester carboxylesterase
MGGVSMTGVRAAAVELSVAVPGGDLAVTRWPAVADGPPVLAVHGIAGNSLTWAPIARRLSEFDLIAPDVRGRSHSRSVAGGYGLARHADDLVLVLDELGISEPVVLVGHSMGAFIACVASVRHPDRFSRLVLVDGGHDFGVMGPDDDLDDVLNRVLGPSMARLAMEFESMDAYYAFWRQHPAFTEIWHADTEAYVDRDLIGQVPRLRSSCVLEAIRADGYDVFVNKEIHAAIHELPVPATLLWAERGLLNEPVGLYTAAALADGVLPDTVSVVAVPDTNHFSILLGDAGADAVAVAVRSERSSDSPDSVGHITGNIR